MVNMVTKLEESCEELHEDPLGSGNYPLEKLDPGKCCSIVRPFVAKTPGDYTVQATFTCQEGETPVTVSTKTQVESQIAATLNIGFIMFAHTLTRLNLNFTLQAANAS
jgi:hypothetical protein